MGTSSKTCLLYNYCFPAQTVAVAALASADGLELVVQVPRELADADAWRGGREAGGERGEQRGSDQ